MAFNAAATLSFRPTREHRKIALFVALSFLCLGLPRVTTNATAFALFLDTFGAANLPYTYLGAAVLAPVIGAGYLWLQRRVSFWTLILCALAFDIVSLSVAWIGLQMPFAKVLIALLTVWVEVEWMIAGLVFWGLAERMFTLRDAKRLFGVISSGEPAAVIVGGFAIPLLLTFMGTRDLVLVSAAAMGLGMVMVLATRTRFGADLAEGHGGDDDEPSGFRVLGGFGRYQPYVNLIFVMVLLAEIAHFVIDNAFYDLAEHRYEDKEALASFIGVFFAASGVVNLLCNVFVSGWVLRRHGVGVAMLSLPGLIIAAGLLAMGAAMLSGPGLAFFFLMASIKLIDEAVRNGVYTTGFLTVYQPLPPELRTRAHAASGSYVEQIAAGVAGMTLLGLNLALGFGAYELCAFAVLISVAWAWTARRQFTRYLEVLGQAISRRRLGSGELTLDSDASVELVEQRLAGKDAGEAIYALSLIETHAPQRLADAVRTLLAHPGADARREALRAAENAGLTELAGEIDAFIAAEGDPGVAAQALRALAAMDENRAMERLPGFLEHENPVLRAGAVSGLMRHCGIDGTLAAGEAFKSLLESPTLAGQQAASAMLEELASPQFYRPLIASIVSDNRIAQRAALRAARRVDAAPMRPALLGALRSRYVGRAAAAALVNAGDSVLPRLAELFDDAACDTGTRARVAWLLGRIGSTAALDLLWERLAAHGLEERLAVAQALGFARQSANEERAQAVWSEIEAARDIAAQLEAGAALAGGSERLEMLRTACREARSRERDRLFLLLAMVLPRDKVLQVAWRHARGVEEERAYALEVLDTLLPARRRSGVLRLLDAAAERTGAPASLDEFLARLDDATPCNAWVRCCALFAGMETGVLPPEPTMRRWSGSPEPALSATAHAALEPNSEGAARMLNIEKVMILRSVPIFSGVPNQFLADIADVLGEQEVEPGETVIREGEKGDRLYVIVNGSFEVSRKGRALTRLGPREVFGELAVLDPEPRAATVTAATEGLLFSLDHEHLDDLMAGSMEIAHGFIRMLCRRIRESNERATPVVAAGEAR